MHAEDSYRPQPQTEPRNTTTILIHAKRQLASGCSSYPPSAHTLATQLVTLERKPQLYSLPVNDILRQEASRALN